MRKLLILLLALGFISALTGATMANTTLYEDEHYRLIEIETEGIGYRYEIDSGWLWFDDLERTKKLNEAPGEWVQTYEVIVGPHTVAYIARDYLPSDLVAILDEIAEE